MEQKKKDNEKLTLQEFEKNIQFVKNQVMYKGLSDANTDKEFEKLINSPNAKNSYVVNDKVEANFGNKASFELEFNRRESDGRLFFNGFTATLTNKNGEKKEQYIQNKFGGITAKESVNLLEGRSVLTKMQSKNGKEFEAYISLNKDGEKTESGNTKLDLVFANRVNVNNTVVGSKLKFDDATRKEQAIKSLEKGNITNVTFDNGKRGMAVLNPYENKLNLYDAKMQRIEFSETLSQDQNQSKGIKI